MTSEVLKSAEVSLTGLAPASAYHYRFIASSGGGGPEYGPRPQGEEGVGGAASYAAGREGTFRTLSSPAAAGPCPANEALRGGLSAALPDCRAYELVSPLDKANGDAALLPATKLAELNQAAHSGDGFTYSSLTPYAEPESAPFLSQYLARRDPAAGWSDEDISPPHTLTPLKELGLRAALHNEFRAFSDDLCAAWLVHVSSSTLAGGAIPGWSQPLPAPGLRGRSRIRGAEHRGAARDAPRSSSLEPRRGGRLGRRLGGGLRLRRGLRRRAGAERRNDRRRRRGAAAALRAGPRRAALRLPPAEQRPGPRALRGGALGPQPRQRQRRQGLGGAGSALGRRLEPLLDRLRRGAVRRRPAPFPARSTSPATQTPPRADTNTARRRAAAS